MEPTSIPALVDLAVRHALANRTVSHITIPTAEVLEAADLLASPIVKTLPGKAAVPDDHPLTTGGLGLLGTAPSEEVMEADTLLMVGTNFPYTKHLPGTCPPARQALAHPWPALVDVMVNPDEPPLQLKG
jgi:pyruvate dehydrogenase (quinone)